METVAHSSRVALKAPVSAESQCGKKLDCSDPQKVLYFVFFLLMMATGHLFCTTKKKKNSSEWLKTQKNANISNKVKTNSGFRFSIFCLMPPSRPPQFGLNFSWHKSVSVRSPLKSSGFQFSCFRVDGGRLLVVGSDSDAGELVPEAGRQDALHLLHDEVQRSKQRAEELQGDTKQTLWPLFHTGTLRLMFS